MSELLTTIEGKRWVTFDIECLNNIDGQRNTFKNSEHAAIAVACTLSSDGEYRDWIENASAWRLMMYLQSFDFVVGYNVIGFDYPLLGGAMFGEYDLKAPKIVENVFLKGKTVDVCYDAKDALGTRVSMDNIATATVGETKCMDGGLAPENWRKGKCMEVIQYCRQDLNMLDKIFRTVMAGKPLAIMDKVGNRKEFKCPLKIR